jgi:hypothetical protein
VQLEYLLQTPDLLLRLPQMLLQPALELSIARILDHLGQRLYDLIFRVIDIPQPVLIEVFEAMDVFRKQAHGRFLLVACSWRS